MLRPVCEVANNLTIRILVYFSGELLLRGDRWVRSPMTVFVWIIIGSDPFPKMIGHQHQGNRLSCVTLTITNIHFQFRFKDCKQPARIKSTRRDWRTRRSAAERKADGTYKKRDRGNDDG